MLWIFALLLLPIYGNCFFFGGGQQCNCGARSLMPSPCAQSPCFESMPSCAPSCSSPCSKKRVSRAINDLEDHANEDRDNTKCNNKLLKQVMIDNMSNDVKKSKTDILVAVEKQFKLTFNVICANGDFSYLTTTRMFCLVTLPQINCYSFLSEMTEEVEAQKKLQ
uniref:Ground-like domain-containing protein n=1 Tax=Rhabditophanes sp. KR3021 TaxID=114890 RepID=A0AC35TSB1_9BILA